MIKKIVVIGPESTGKSTLCRQLADHYKTMEVKEYAREYLETNGKAYTFGDLIKISEGQLKQEDEGVEKLIKDLPKTPLLFIDTDSYVLKVWSEYVFNKCDNRILNNIANRHYDHYFLCNTDLPWEADDLREYPDLETRNKLFHFYKDAMVNQNVSWTEISGNYDQRLLKAISSIEIIINR